MRIISGFYKGRKLLEPKDNKTRPLKDLTKESIFNIINHSNKFSINIEKANVLDLFSGVGSFGIECLSRGAKHVIFCENYDYVLSILKKNLSNLKSMKNYEIIEKNIYDDKVSLSTNKKFDLIFMDPPYKDKNLEKIFKKILNEKFLNRNSIIIMHRHRDQKDLLPPDINIIEEKKYGINKILFMSTSF